MTPSPTARPRLSPRTPSRYALRRSRRQPRCPLLGRSGNINTNNNRREVGPLQASAVGPLQTAAATHSEQGRNAASAPGPALTEAISAAIVELYAASYGHDRTTATTYINDNIVLCVLENILTTGEHALVADGARGEVIDGRVAFQTDTEDEFTAAIQRLTHRRVVAFMSANQTTPGVACELFFLDAAPLTASSV